MNKFNSELQQQVEQEKAYFQLFIDQIHYKLMCNNPPVRRPNSQKK